jgi:hypothetical protein
MKPCNEETFWGNVSKAAEQVARVPEGMKAKFELDGVIVYRVPHPSWKSIVRIDIKEEILK